MKKIAASDGSTELLKWIGLVLMTGDHINRFLFNATLPVLFELGRLCLPIFVFVLAYNLARPDALARHVHQRTLLRLGVFGLLASVPRIYLGGLYQGWWPLNVLFTLMVIVATAYLVERGGIHRWATALVFLVGGSMVEYWWPAVALGLCSWWYCKNASAWALFGALLSCFFLGAVNGNHWALAAFPLIGVVIHSSVPVPRLRWVFYAYYPAHLVAIALLRIPMARAGYLFS